MTTLFGVQQFGLPQKGDAGTNGTNFARVKSQAVFTGMSQVISTTPVNLVTMLKALTPASGSLGSFFDIVNDKLIVNNVSEDVNFKLNITGAFGGGTIILNFATGNGNGDNVTTNRISVAGATDQYSLNTFFAVDQGGSLATNGAAVTLATTGGNLTILGITLVVTQIVPT